MCDIRKQISDLKYRVNGYPFDLSAPDGVAVRDFLCQVVDALDSLAAIACTTAGMSRRVGDDWIDRDRR